MDLIGIPIRITVGKKINENMVEVKLRNQNEAKDLNAGDVVEFIKDIISKNK